MSNTNKPKKVKIFKIHGLDSNEFLTLLLHLSTAPNNSHEKAYNSLIFANSFALFNDLRGLDVPKLNQLANLVSDCFEIRVDVEKLSKHIASVKNGNSNRFLHQDQLKFLITHHASNEMIFSLCSSINHEDIKRFRLQNSLPAVKGRRRMPEGALRQKIIEVWHSLSNIKDLFERYKRMAEMFLTLELGQLYAVIQAEEKN